MQILYDKLKRKLCNFINASNKHKINIYENKEECK